MKYIAIFFSLGAGLAALTAAAAPVVPGEFTDPSNIKRALKVEAPYETPVDFQHPYISTYYVKPIVTVDENVEFAYYITDFDHSLVRMRDDSFRFDVHLKVIGPDGKELTRIQKGVKSGDGAFRLKPLPKGDYKMCIWGVDLKKNIESHRVWHRFRVVEQSDLVIPADKVYTMTADDLGKYGICNKGDLGRKVLVEVPVPPKKMKFADQFRMYKDEVVKYAAANPQKPRDGEKGYTVFVPARDGRIIANSWRAVHIVNDPGYDTNKVAEAAFKTSEGLNRLLADKADEGFRKVVLLPGTYRVSSRKSISMPSRMTFDLNGATLKLDRFTGCSGTIVALKHTYDAHLVNGTIEGDYFEHDYANSPNNSEWPLGFSISGDSSYTTVENVYVKNITGYGGSNGIGKKNGALAVLHKGLGKHVEGALNPKDGTLDTSRKDLFTSGYIPVSADKVPWLQVSKYLGYQGVRTRQWTLTGCWYDKDKKFISSETIWQYRVIPVPKNAAFLRVTQFNSSLADASKSELTITKFFVPENCAVIGCTFDRCRCVGYAASAMKNFLFKDNLFTRSGESAAKCAFDAEDGWDQMQDATFIGNKCRDNPVNNSLLTCAGHNFVFEGNEGDLYFWGRTHSPCVRSNAIGRATFRCDSQVRSGYGRFEGNTYERGFDVPGSGSRGGAGWDYAFRDFDYTGEVVDKKFKMTLGDSARIVNSRFSDREVNISKAVGCRFDRCTVTHHSPGIWVGVEMNGGKLVNFRNSSRFEKCRFSKMSICNFWGGVQTFNGCTFDHVNLSGISGSTLRFENCRFIFSSYWNGYWTKASDVSFKNCTFEIAGQNFMRLGAYGVGDTLFEGCRLTTTNRNVIVADVTDWRANKPGDDVTGRITFKDCELGEGIVHAIGCSQMRWNGGVKAGRKPTKTILYTTENVRMSPGREPVGRLPNRP